MTPSELLGYLRTIAGGPAVHTDAEYLALMSADLYARGPLPLAVVCPSSPETLAQVIAKVTAAGYCVVPRGGGLSYTGGYLCPDGAETVLIDISGINRIVTVSESDMYLIAEAGATWKQLQQALMPRGLRLPFFGTFSGAGATIGGGLSHGALFFGSARYGSAAENVLGLEVATADGELLRTGQWSHSVARKPIFRHYGPDTTGLFLHDGGALGIKTRVVMRLIPTPTHSDYASFAFSSLGQAAAALSAVARANLAEEAYVLDPAAVALHAKREQGVKAAFQVIHRIGRTAHGLRNKLWALAELARAGRRVIPDGAFTLHLVVAASTRDGVSHDLHQAHILAARHGGVPIAATVPRLARADPFPNLDGVLDPTGSRWAALNVKVAHSDAAGLIADHQALMASHRETMDALGVKVTYLCSALLNCSFSFEAVFHWHDTWLPLHRSAAQPKTLARLAEPAPNLAARELVAVLRSKTCELFAQIGGASTQIGRTYPFLDTMAPAPAALLKKLKATLDPQHRMNPGVLGL